MTADGASGIDRLLRHLLWLGIADFLLISAFDIHRWRVEHWRAFDALFTLAARAALHQHAQPVWLYALAFPFVAVNFGCMVLLLRGRRRGLFWPFIVSAAAIALMPLAGEQTVIYRSIWPDVLTAFGYAIGGAIATIIGLRLDSRSPVDRAADNARN